MNPLFEPDHGGLRGVRGEGEHNVAILIISIKVAKVIITIIIKVAQVIINIIIKMAKVIITDIIKVAKVIIADIKLIIIVTDVTSEGTVCIQNLFAVMR